MGWQTSVYFYRNNICSAHGGNMQADYFVKLKKCLKIGQFYPHTAKQLGYQYWLCAETRSEKVWFGKVNRESTD